MNSRETLLRVAPLLTRAEVLDRPCPIPAASGVYGWWFDEIPTEVPTSACVTSGPWTLLYIGISPKAPPRNGAPASRQTLRTRVRYHFRGNAEGSTLRLTLGVLLSEKLGLELRRVGSGKRRTFSVGERDLSLWMHDHARVSFVEDLTPWKLEEELIGSIDLPLNLDQNSNHVFHSELSARRKASKTRAIQLPVLQR